VKNLACYSISKKNDWINEINDWQKPIIQNKNLPIWYKRVIFNELYFIADGKKN
jgi:non-lysosomal glucosylceramidase